MGQLGSEPNVSGCFRRATATLQAGVQKEVRGKHGSWRSHKGTAANNSAWTVSR